MPYKDVEEGRKKRREHYLANKEKYAESGKVSRQGRKRFWIGYKKDLECKRCGENPHYAAMHFHHIDPSTKVATVNTLINDNVSIDRVLTEIEKCDPLCANCHAIVEHEAKYGPVA